jgi:hypothetical protein
VKCRSPIPGYVFAPRGETRTRCAARMFGTARLGREATIETGPRPTLSLAEVKPSRSRPFEDRMERPDGAR